MKLPPRSEIRQFDTHRLIPSKYSADSVLSGIADDQRHLEMLFDLDALTNDRLLAENELAPGIGSHELVYGLPYASVVNAAFCHPHPLGSRFNSAERGAWYAGFELATAQAEIIHHRTIALAEVDWWEDVATYDDYLADFTADFHDIRDRSDFADCLAPDSYRASQRLAERLLSEGALGLVYPSVRRRGGTCLACFRPPVVAHVRKQKTYEFAWEGRRAPRVRARSA